MASAATKKLGSRDSSTHLFFDDERENLEQVAESVATYNKANPEAQSIHLETILCEPGRVTLIDKTEGSSGIALTTVSEYKSRKIIEPEIKSKSMIKLLSEFGDKGIGSGLSLDLIDEIIKLETVPHNKRTCLYFFDFDKVLSQLGSMALPQHKSDGILSTYARFLFSDHIQEEDPHGSGRLTKLREMFSAIGPERTYIMTFNGAARESSNPVTQDDRKFFIALLQQLLPTIKPSNVKFCMVPVSVPGTDKKKGEPNKGRFIVEAILEYEKKHAASPRSASARSASPKKAASPRSASARSASPKKAASPRSASARSASPKKAASPRSKSPRSASPRSASARSKSPGSKGGSRNRTHALRRMRRNRNTRRRK
jgi:hypothetical protein